MNSGLEVPTYMKIAVDMAGRIYKGEFLEGEKLRGRSTLAGEYNVSPETIRRAMRLLEDMEVVTVTQGSGIYVKSKEKAYLFMERFKQKESIGELKNSIRNLLEQKKMIELEIQDKINTIVEFADKLKHSNLITPIEIALPPNSHIIGKNIYDTKFWQNTGATIVGIKRGKRLIISPGPYLEFQEGDILLIVGDPYIHERTSQFLSK
ncbi:TrkA C-terminal domain-containing protein [Defluviitalea saccharophila]|uniref:TrkA C-terminal domain-containing protein n=1 Tax=Defluviitalea saccharophila TaxID=879970 RepID=A0ABZ2Y284_9FIRM|nr:GntR family transcriptional regulator [Candidatus Epulonipiscium sp.]